MSRQLIRLLSRGLGVAPQLEVLSSITTPVWGSVLPAPAAGVSSFSAPASAARTFSTSPASSLSVSATIASDLERYHGTILYPESQVAVGEPAPDFEAPAVVDGEFKTISLSQYKGQYVVLFFYPKDFTFVCPTEIIAFSDRAKEFEALNCKLIAASTDTEETHLAWIRTSRKKGGLGFMQIPLLADVTKEIAARYGVLIETKGIALRGLFIINPEGIVEQITINSLPIGRSVDETLRLLQAIQYVKEHGEVCPANWKPGGKTMVATPEASLDYFETVETGHTEQAFATKLQPITNKKEYEAAIASDKPVVIDFYAHWCGKCRQIGPHVDKLVDKYPGVAFYKIDTSQTDELEWLSSGVTSLPTFKLFKGGKEVSQVVGYKPRPLEEAVQAL